MTNCGTCRFWSEMCAQSIGCGPIEALCLADGGPKQGKFTTETFCCPKHKPNTFGAIDSYGEHARAAYAILENND